MDGGGCPTCSRCLPIETKVTPLAWTLSTLGQTKHETSKGHSRGEVNLDSIDTNELLKQYRHLQVGDKKEYEIDASRGRAACSNKEFDSWLGFVC